MGLLLRRLKFLLPLLLVGCPQIFAQTATSLDSQHISVRLSCDDQRPRVGDKIPIKVELTNLGDKPLIFPNLISDSDRVDGHVELYLVDSNGRESPRMRRIADSLTPYPAEPDWKLMLGRWLVLYPGYSLATSLYLSDSIFSFLKLPGKYKVTAEYSSGGLSSQENYRPMGLKANDAATLPFSSWTGKVRSNSIWLTVIPGQQR